MEPLPNQGNQLSGICAEVCPQGVSKTVEYTTSSAACLPVLARAPENLSFCN